MWPVRHVAARTCSGASCFTKLVLRASGSAGLLPPPAGGASQALGFRVLAQQALRASGAAAAGLPPAGRGGMTQAA
jgi:hypothetical protein